MKIHCVLLKAQRMEVLPNVTLDHFAIYEGIKAVHLKLTQCYVSIISQ